MGRDSTKSGHGPGPIESLLASIGKGPRITGSANAQLSRLFGVPVALEGLSRLFQPGFPGVRAFAVEVRAAPDQAIEFTLVGVARDGSPVWHGTRAFAHGRDGSLEIHRGFDEIDPAYQSRNITVDLMQRELDILALLDRGASSRLTIDAENVGRYVCALHGFIFADETEDGPPVRSAWALSPQGDRQRLVEAAPRIVERIAEKERVGRIGVEAALKHLRAAKTPWDFARATLPGSANELAPGDDGELGVGALGRELLLAADAPPWRAALYLHPRLDDPRRAGDEYRRRKTMRSEARLAREIQAARDGLTSSQRATRARALRTLGMIAPTWIIPDVKKLTTSLDRREAALARQTVREIAGSDLPERLLAFADNQRRDPAMRALAIRVLAEHFPARIEDGASLLRVHPDARVQRAVIPAYAREALPGPELASMLAANPWEPHDPRPGLVQLRLELIERIAEIADPSTLPVLIAAFRAVPQPRPAEMLALSRALVVFPDRRAQQALAEVASRFERPAIP